MKSKTVDYINIWLLIISFVVAIYLPFELFLFSYAVLGPLHYLTEINWLEDKKFFLKSKSIAYKSFLVFAIIIAVFPLIKYLGALDSFENLVGWFTPKKSQFLLLSGFTFSVCLIFIDQLKHLILAFILSVIFSLICNFYVPKIAIAIAVFLPTLIHVYVFTLLFMLYGQLKSKSKPGLISVLFLMLVPLIIFGLDIDSSTYIISEGTKETYSGSGFLPLNNNISRLFIDVSKDSFDILSPLGIKIQIFIAFAYTYHYLNWFSKTSIIGWKTSLTSSRMKYIIVLWLCAVGIYLYNYILGLTALFFLSLLHVVLEFPLNVITIKELTLEGLKKLNLRSK